MHRHSLSKSAFFGFFLVAIALAGCSSDANPETSGGGDDKSEPTNDGGNGAVDAEGSSDEGTLTLEALSSSGAAWVQTYRGRKPASGEITGDFVSCKHVIPTSGTLGPFVSILAGTPESSALGDVEYFPTNVSNKAPMKRTDSYQRDSLDPSPVQVSIAIGPKNRYHFFYDDAASLTSTCTTELTEFTETRLKGKAACTDLVPQASAIDWEPDFKKPQHSATMTITFDCPLD